MDTSTTILAAASALLDELGPEGLTTRAVCEAAGVKSPTLYHHFGGKDGLERALLERSLADFMRHKRMPPESADPLDQLWAGWSLAVEFALSRPQLWRLYAQHSTMHQDLLADGYAVMKSRVQRLVDLGRFEGPVDVAARAVWAASQGVLALVGQGQTAKNVKATSELLFQAVTARLGGISDAQ